VGIDVLITARNIGVRQAKMGAQKEPNEGKEGETV